MSVEYTPERIEAALNVAKSMLRHNEDVPGTRGNRLILVEVIEELRSENGRLQKTKDLIRGIQDQCGDIRDLEAQGRKCQPWTDEAAFNAFNRKLTYMCRDAFHDLGVLLGPDAVETLYGNNCPKEPAQ